MIGQPFSQRTREHFLPLLTSTAWWSDTRIALRRIFVQDADFKESMFARQMAVMKGQAWNVVETLKQPDHGPLELTRHTRVCVWDDVVDVPVAIPLRSPSRDAYKRRDNLPHKNVVHEDDEEMDIAMSHNDDSHDLLNLGSPGSELPNPNRFELNSSRPPTETDSVREHERPGSPLSIHESYPSQHVDAHTAAKDIAASWNGGYRPGSPLSKNQRNSETRRPHWRGVPSSRKSVTPSIVPDGDDLEGDLGYAVAEEMEGNQRRVIVERLETVKSKNPVFTWC